MYTTSDVHRLPFPLGAPFPVEYGVGGLLLCLLLTKFFTTACYAEVFKIQGDMKTFLQLTIGIFRFAFHSEDVARCYRNLGYYFIENHLWQDAASCYYASLQYEKDSQHAVGELNYIQQRAGKDIEVKIDDFRETGKKYGFPVGADENVIRLAYAHGKHFFEKKDPVAARYYLSILYDLTDDERVKEMIDQLPNENEVNPADE